MAIFELLTDVGIDEVNALKLKCASDETNPRDLKIRSSQKHYRRFSFSEEDANKAEENFINQFSKGNLPDEIDEIADRFGRIQNRRSIDGY